MSREKIFIISFALLVCLCACISGGFAACADDAEGLGDSPVSDTQEIEPVIEQLDIKILDNGLVDISENFTINNSLINGSGSLSFIIPKAVKGSVSASVNSEDETKKLDYTTETVETASSGTPSDIITISAKDLAEGQKGSTEVSLGYKTQVLTTKNLETWLFDFFAKTTPGRTEITITFPQGASVSFLDDSNIHWAYNRRGHYVLEITPASDEINISCRYRFIDILVDELVDEGADDIEIEDEVNESAGLENLTDIEVYKITDDSVGFLDDLQKFINSNYPVILILILILIILALLFLKYRDNFSAKEEQVVESDEVPEGAQVSQSEIPPAESVPPEVAENVLKMLNESEKRIIEMLEQRGEITQAFIYKSTRLPKTTLSRLIKGLEQRNIIDTRIDGRVKWIKLKEWVFEKNNKNKD